MKKRISLLVSFLFLLHYLSVAQVPGTLSYQGILVDAGGAPVTDGNHTVTFSFYTVVSGGSAVFSRGPITVQTYKGLFTTIIGDGAANNAALPILSSDPNYIGGSQYFLEVVADGVTLLPRAQLSTVPYALHAQNANTMNASGLTGTGTLPTTVLPSTSVTPGSYGSATQVPTFTVDTKGRLTAASNVAISGSGWGLTGNAGTVEGTNFIGTTDSKSLLFKMNNQAAGKIDAVNGGTFFGTLAGNSNSSGAINVGIGLTALTSNTTGASNTAIGYDAMANNIVGNSNSALGSKALESNVAGSKATAIGYNAMQYANNTATPFDNTNIAIGYEALMGSATPSSNTGGSNTAIGYESQRNTTTGYGNTSVGRHTLNANVSGYDNTAIGSLALAVSTGINNTAVGSYAMPANTTGGENTAIGTFALGNNTTGLGNIAVGSSALAANIGGNSNTALGVLANVGSANLTNATAIGANAIVGASNSMVLGGTGANAVKVGIGITVPTTELHLSHGNVGPSSGHGLTLQNSAGAQSWAMWVSNATGNLNLYQDNNFIGGFDDSNGNYTPVSDGRLKKNVSLAEYALPGLLKIRVRRYHFNSQPDSDLKNIGVIAQELKEIYPELVKYNPDGDRYTVDYMSLVPLTIKAIQEQQDLIKSYEQRINELDLAFEKNQQVILELHAMIKSLAVKVNELTQAKSSLVSSQTNSGN